MSNGSFAAVLGLTLNHVTDSRATPAGKRNKGGAKLTGIFDRPGLQPDF
jgi:hypothetical protein